MKTRSAIAVFALCCMGLPAYAIPITGSSSCIFQNPTGPAGMQVTGVGTDTFSWGTGSPPSSLECSESGFDTETGSFFDVGLITYFNGAIVGGSEANSVDLALELSLTNPTGIVQNFVYMLALLNTPNNGTAEQNADLVAFPTVLPNQTFVVDGTTYSLALEVGSVTGEGFSTQTTFSVLEGRSATATLRGLITAVSVPEPDTLALFGIGLLGMGLTGRRKKV